jgi:hypothetical protein
VIPSRPLSLVEIIGETFSISVRIFPRYALLFAILLLPGIALTTYGTIDFFEQTLSNTRHDLALTDNDLTVLRDEGTVWLDTHVAYFEQEAKLFGFQDSTSHPDARVHLHQVREYLSANASLVLWPFAAAVFGGLLWLIGGMGVLACTVDLASQEFEERRDSLSATLRAALRSNLWRLLLLYLIYVLFSAFREVLFSLLDFVSAPISAFFGSVLFTAEIYVAVRLIGAIPALISEEIGPRAALTRSWGLTRAHSMRIFWSSVAFGIICFLIAIVVSVIVGVIFSSVFHDFRQVFSLRPMTFAWLTATLPKLLWSGAAMIAIFVLALAPLFAVFATVFYYDLRTRHDGPLVYLD